MAIPAKTTEAMTRLFMQQMKAEKILPSLVFEYEKVGYWKGLWLKLTGRKPRIIYPKISASPCDTITFRRPSEYLDK